MKQKVLVVEDEQVLCELIAKVLEGFGCEVKTARTANEARMLLAKPFRAQNLKKLLLKATG